MIHRDKEIEMFKAKKIYTGCYQYRNHTIEYVESCWHQYRKHKIEYVESCWLIKHDDHLDAQDAANSFKDAKTLIDQWTLENS